MKRDAISEGHSTEAKANADGRDAILSLARDRDAYATIRGFVYQVDLTILRWLDLRNDETLELERGEDIDRLSRGMENFETWERLLEQVKHLERNITLRSPSVRAALANFYEHRSLNQERVLRFRFTTNAHTGTENPNPMPAGEPGLAAWQRLHSADIPRTEIPAVIAGIRSLLVDAPRPSGLDKETWQAWQDFVSTAEDADLASFVSKVEIATGSVDPADLQPKIEARLRDEGFAAEGSAATSLYRVLFVSVFKRLSTRGRKQLDRDGLLAEVSGTGMGSSDTDLADKLAQLREQVDVRLEAVEQQLDSLWGEVTEVREEISKVARGIAATTVPRGVRPGDTRTFQITANHFGRTLDPNSTFNHARAMVGRDQELSVAVEEVEAVLTRGSGIVVLSGPGGVGKSRLLLEVANELEERGHFQVRWVRGTETPRTDALNELPEGPVAIFCDDAHRRSDLPDVLATAEARADPTAVVIGIRPHGRDALRVAAFQARIGSDRITELEELRDLETEDLERLVALELGPEDEPLAEAVVHVTRGSTLVATVAARLLQTRRLNPGVLAHDPEVHHVVFSGFEDEIYGRVGPSTDERVARQALELLAVIGPFSMDDDELVTRAAEFIGVDPPPFRRAVAALQEAGVLTEQRSGLRITPDVLSDHILYRALVAGGRPTGEEIRILDQLGPSVLPNLVRNVAELDWQLDVTHEGAAGRPEIFSQVWNRFVAHFEASTRWSRMNLLDALRPVAAFQPAPVLDLCQSIIEDPSGPPDTEGEPYFGPASVLTKIPSLLAITCQHQDHYERALDLLWTLGANDDRELNPNPEHAIRILGDVVKYAPRRFVWRQELALRALRRWTRHPGWSEQRHSPLVVADAVLQTSMVEDRFDPRAHKFTMTRYGVNPEATRDVRRDAVTLLEDLVLGDEPRGRIWATESLLQALNPPDSQFGHVVTDEEEEGFREQYEAAFDAIARISERSDDALVRIKLRDGLQWVVRRRGLDWKKERAQELIAELPEDEETEIARVWSQNFHDAFTSWDEASSRGATVTSEVAARLLAEAEDANQLIQCLIAEFDRFEAAGVPAQPGYLLAELSRQNPDRAAEIASGILEAGEGDPASKMDGLLHVVLGQLRRHSRSHYDARVGFAATHTRPLLRRSLALTLRWIDAKEPWDEVERIQLRNLLRDEDPAVRAAAVEALQAASAEEAAEFLPLVAVDGHDLVARAVADLWAYRKPADWPPLDTHEVDRLLEGFVELPHLDRNQMHVEEMLAALARSEPLSVLEFIISRVEREVEESRNPKGDWLRGYDAVPYGGFHGVWAGLQASGQHAAIVRRLLTAIADETRTVAEPWRRKAVEVARNIMQWDSEVEAAIREWMREDRIQDLAALAPLLESQPQSFVLDRREFVTDLLAWLDEREAPADDTVRDALLASTDRPIRARRVGEANPVDVRLRDEAIDIAAALGEEGHPASSFYRRVAQEAQNRIDRDTERDERHDRLDQREE